MTGIGENTLAQPVKPPLRERCACLAKLVKNRLTLTGTGKDVLNLFLDGLAREQRRAMEVVAADGVFDSFYF